LSGPVESECRGLEFVTRKITWHAASIKHGLRGHISLGNLDAERDCFDVGLIKLVHQAVQLVSRRHSLPQRYPRAVAHDDLVLH